MLVLYFGNPCGFFFFFDVNFTSVIIFCLNKTILLCYHTQPKGNKNVGFIFFSGGEVEHFHFNPLSGSTKENRKLNFYLTSLTSCPLDLVLILKRNNLELDMKKNKALSNPLRPNCTSY